MLNIPKPAFYVDPSHRTKILAKKIFQLLSKGKSVTSITKGDCLKSKKYFGYFLKQHRHQSKEIFALVVKAPLGHLFDNHEICGPWCKRKKNIDGLVQQHQFYRNKEKDNKLYLQMSKIYSDFIAGDNLEQCRPGFTTQANESFNMTIASYAPKNQVYGSSMPLTN